MSKDSWEKVSFNDFMADVAKEEGESYKMRPHQFAIRKRISWPICKSCGLVSLRNKLSHWAEKHGCLYSKHPAWKGQIGKANQ